MFYVLLGMENNNDKKQAKHLLQVIGHLDPAIIKSGQALVLRLDHISIEYLKELNRLQHNVPHFSNGITIATVEK